MIEGRHHGKLTNPYTTLRFKICPLLYSFSCGFTHSDSHSHLVMAMFNLVVEKILVFIAIYGMFIIVNIILDFAAFASVPLPFIFVFFL